MLKFNRKKDPKTRDGNMYQRKKGNNNTNKNIDKSIQDQAKGNRTNAANDKGANPPPKHIIPKNSVVISHNSTGQIENMDIVGPSNAYKL